MSELILHIGSHKTGTTSIQRACLSHLSPIPGTDTNIQYINIRPTGTQIIVARGSGAGFRAEIVLKLADQLFHPGETRTDQRHKTRFIASDETFFWISEPETVQRFAGMLKQRFERIRILCYLRRQDQLAVSHRKQVGEIGMPAARFYGVTCTPLPVYQPYLHRYFDYAAKLADIWVPAFGKKNVTVVPYAPDTLVNGDVVEDFAQQAGVQFSLPAVIRGNESLDGNRTLVALKLTEMGVPRSRHHKILASLPGTGRFLPSQAEAQAFLARFAEPNDRLARDWLWNKAPFRFDDSFDMYPEADGPEWSTRDVRRMIESVRRGARPDN